MKFIVMPLFLLLIFSFLANMYSFNRLGTSNEKVIADYENVIEKKNDEITELLTKIDSEQTKKIDDHIVKEGSENQSPIVEDEKSILNIAERYLEFAFNSTPENYVTRKNNAHNYMTEDMVNLIFQSDGVDEDFYMKIKNIKLYKNDDSTDEVIAYYESEIETYETKNVEKNYNYVLLKFKEEKGITKISNIIPINIWGAN